MKARLLGTGSAIPGENIAGSELDNVELAKLMEEVRERMAVEAPDVEVLPTDAEFPLRRLGVRSRRILDADLSARDLAVVAAREALKDSGVPAESIGAVFVNVTAPDGLSPSTASTVHHALGLEEDVMAFDQSLGCNGFIGAMYSAEGSVGRNPERPNAIVIGAEYLTSVADAADRTTMPIFGDGGGAAVFGPADRDDLSPIWMATRGSSAENITVFPIPGDHSAYRIRSRGGKCQVEVDKTHRYAVKMLGREVFKDMVRLLPPRIEAYCERAGVDMEEIDLFLFHQANARMIEAMSQRLIGAGVSERVPVNIGTLGNSSSATIPILLDQVRRAGTFGPGKRAMLCGFGTGYSMGMTLLRG